MMLNNKTIMLLKQLKLLHLGTPTINVHLIKLLKAMKTKIINRKLSLLFFYTSFPNNKLT